MRLKDWIRLSPVFFRCLGRLPVRHLVYLARQMRHENPHRLGGLMYLNTFFPPYPSRAFDRFLAAVIEKRRIPYSTYFAVTDQCPYRCEHCSYGRHQAGRLDTQGACEIIEQIKGLGTINIGLTGGEPLLREDIVTLVAAIGPEAGSIVFSTGYGLTAELAGRLRAAGLNCLMIGLESDDRGRHDATRGQAGSFEQAMAAIRYSREAGLYTAISSVASRDKIADGTLGRLAKLGERVGAHEFRILSPVPTGERLGCGCYWLSAGELAAVRELHKRWNRRGIGPAVASFAWLESDAMFGCGAGYHHLFIDAVGNVCPCDLTPLSFGNAREMPLAEIWAAMGSHFSLPRRSCFMRDIYDSLSSEVAGDLPLGPEASECLAGKKPHDGRLPTLYQNYFNEP